VILACETLYWGGWDLLSDDTRDAQLATLLQVCIDERVSAMRPFGIPHGLQADPVTLLERAVCR